MQVTSITPIFRIFDVTLAEAFYLRYLGFNKDFEHRFEPDYPIYMGLSFGEIELHLSEHHGDVTPGSAARISITDVDAYCEQLKAKQYRFYNPSVHSTSWGSKEMSVLDPFRNTLIFVEAS